jgi:putative pyruvate formate lyase activating enzyme
MEPSYIRLHANGQLRDRAEKALHLMESCRLCPRKCGINRLKGETGVCGIGRKAKVASYNAHFGEEAPLVGNFGSGTIFLSSCNLLCSFCQNYDISHDKEGVEVGPEQMAAMMVLLAERGCHNINFVTPTHVVPQIIEALTIAAQQGLKVPLVYNSSGYDSEETLLLLDGIFDIYMPDFKFWDGNWSERYCDASDYRERTVTAIKEMYRQVGDLALDENGIAYKGLLVRHLVMPNQVAGTKNITAFLAKEISINTYVNIMDQYRPCGDAYQDEFINRSLTNREYREAIDAAKSIGLNRLDSKEQRRLIFAI